ncbi:MAG: hypothetical protein ACRC2K_05250 [Clostridium sp.]
MKVVSKSIQVIAAFDNLGGIKPIRFKLDEEDKNVVIKIDRIITEEMEKLAGNIMKVFNCISVINGVERRYQIKYEIKTCRWILFKI